MDFKKWKFTQFQLDSLAVHNEYRLKHNVPPLKLNKKLCGYAKFCSSECARLKQMSRSPYNKIGENIFVMISSDPSHTPTGRNVVSTWYSDIHRYTFGSGEFKFESLHFTQVTQREITEMGIDMAKNGGHTYVVASYTT